MHKLELALRLCMSFFEVLWGFVTCWPRSLLHRLLGLPFCPGNRIHTACAEIRKQSLRFFQLVLARTRGLIFGLDDEA